MLLGALLEARSGRRVERAPGDSQMRNNHRFKSDKAVTLRSSSLLERFIRDAREWSIGLALALVARAQRARVARFTMVRAR